MAARPESRTTWHNVLSFNAGANNYLRTLQKGSHVYVEANFEVREADPAADPSTPYGQRQIFLRHGTYCAIHPRGCLMYVLEKIRVLRGPTHQSEEQSEENF